MIVQFIFIYYGQVSIDFNKPVASEKSLKPTKIPNIFYCVAYPNDNCLYIKHDITPTDINEATNWADSLSEEQLKQLDEENFFININSKDALINHYIQQKSLDVFVSNGLLVRDISRKNDNILHDVRMFKHLSKKDYEQLITDTIDFETKQGKAHYLLNPTIIPISSGVLVHLWEENKKIIRNIIRFRKRRKANTYTSVYFKTSKPLDINYFESVIFPRIAAEKPRYFADFIKIMADYGYNFKENFKRKQ